jgi:DNA-binding transcriptional MerR regulator
MTEDSKEKLFKLSELARLTDTTRQTIQYYLMLELIKENQRTVGGQRLFDKSHVQKVKLIRKLNQSGYSLRDIRELFLKKT